MTAVVRFICLGLATIALTASNARAEIVLNLGVADDASTIGQTVFSIAPGSTMLLGLYATQQGTYDSGGFTFTELRLSNAAASETGVGAFIVDVLTFNAAGNQQGNVRATGVVNPGPGFFQDSPPELSLPNGLRFQGVGGVALPDQVPVFATNPAPPSLIVPTPGTIQENSVLLSTFEVRAVAGATGDFTLQVTAEKDIGLTLGSNPFGPFVANIPALSATITTTAVPEPSAFALAGLCVCGIGYRQRRKAKRVKETQPLA